jgi:pimeloyl-ACP methyl ester carboxylesterase
MRPRIATRLPGTPELHLAVQPAQWQPAEDVLYVHGATFPSALSIFFRFDGVSWADALNDAGYNAWGLDFAGYGESGWPEAMHGEPGAAPPVGRAEEAAPQVRRALEHIVGRNGGAPVHVIAHSWGTLVAGRVAAASPGLVRSLVMFGPIAPREGAGITEPREAWRLLTVWQQYRRFIEDVPRGAPAVLADRHIHEWAAAYLATDPESAGRSPPAVKTPSGPAADIAAAWRAGSAGYNLGAIRCPLLVVRGEWDSLCNDDDARRLLAATGSTMKRDMKLARGTHLMHLEENRGDLHAASIEFLRAAV